MQWHVPGFVAVVRRGQGDSPMELAEALLRSGIKDAEINEVNGILIATWGLPWERIGQREPVLLSGTNWSDAGPVAADTIGDWAAGENLSQVKRMLPPFAALGQTSGGLRLVTDSLGFRQIFLVERPGWSALSTTARLLAILAGSGLDKRALVLQSQLGWQLGQQTLFNGVTKLPPGASVLIQRDGIVQQVEPPAAAPSVSLRDGVRDATVLLRQFLSRYLDHNPSTTLQLTGGQDSRLVLSGIDRARRRGLKVMTLAVPGSVDALVAGRLAEQFGMRHTVRSLDGLTNLTTDEAFERVCAAASRLDCMADPLARAATLWAEESFDQGPRLSGLGGEIARGFYYTGRVRPVAVTRQRAQRLAAWRILVNEVVESPALRADLAENAESESVEFIHHVLAETGKDWYSATDELYSRHRMQRWAGLGETAVCFDRQIVNPLLDRRFLAIAEGLDPRDKSHARFLAHLQVSLDEELAAIPLDNRPAPRQMARSGVRAAIPRYAAQVRLARGKLEQRVRGERRPPPGGAVFADKVVQFIRENPSVVDPLRNGAVFRPEWLDDVIGGRASPAPSSVALLVNVLVATDG